MNGNNQFKIFHSRIPQTPTIRMSLKLRETTGSKKSTQYLDFMLSYDTDGHMKISLYYKREDFDFIITNISICG